MTVRVERVPVRMYANEGQIVLVAPLPGLEAEDISVSITGKRVSIEGAERGPGQHERDLLLEEWNIGPYYREVVLPEGVNGPLTNATYGNGILVLVMPKAEEGTEGVPADFQLQPIGATRGERVGHTGKDMHPSTTTEHMKKHNPSGK